MGIENTDAKTASKSLTAKEGDNDLTCFSERDDLELSAGWVSQPLYANRLAGAEEAGQIAPLQELRGQDPRVQQAGIRHRPATAPTQHAVILLLAAPTHRLFCLLASNDQL